MLNVRVGRAHFALLLLAASTPAPADDSSLSPSFAPIEDLAGSCWVGTFPNGARDQHCYEWVLQEGFLHDYHAVRGGPSDGIYEGDTYFGWSQEAQQLVYWYFNSLGGVSEGVVAQEDGAWFFREEHAGSRGVEEGLKIRSRMTRPDQDSYAVTTEFLRDGAWKRESEMTYRRQDVPAARFGGAFAADYDLVFNSDRSSNYDVYRLDLRTGATDNLTSSPGTEWAYTGGEGLVLVSNRPTGSEPGYRLYRMATHSRELVRLTDFPVADSWLAVLPGRTGYVICAEIRGDRELLQIDAHGGIVAQLTDNESDDCNPDITPDGETLIFWSDRSGSGELWSRPLAGGSARRLTDHDGNDGVSMHRYGGEGPPRVSPDGRRIAWMSIRDGKDWDVYTMTVEGGDVRRLTDSLSDDGYPSWSPDGAWIAFDSDRYGSFDLFVVGAEGGRSQRLTDDPGYDQAPVWVPRAAGLRTE